VTPSFVALLALVALALASMPFHALRRQVRDADADKKGVRFLLGVGDFLLHWFLWAIAPVERLLIRLGAVPDQLNAGGLAFGLLSGILIGVGRVEAGGWAILGAGLCDVLDGRLARARSLTSAYGKFIDSTLDRFVETFAFLGFAVYLDDRPWGALIAAAGLGGSLLVSYAQARGETVGVSGSGGLMQRAERLALQILGCLLDPVVSRGLGQRDGTLLFSLLALMAAGTLATAAYRTVWIARRLRER
jgi:phosphatidylglycerophosphate synthase